MLRTAWLSRHEQWETRCLACRDKNALRLLKFELEKFAISWDAVEASTKKMPEGAGRRRRVKAKGEGGRKQRMGREAGKGTVRGKTSGGQKESKCASQSDAVEDRVGCCEAQWRRV